MSLVSELDPLPEASYRLFLILLTVLYPERLVLLTHIAHKWLLVAPSIDSCRMLLKGGGSGLPWEEFGLVYVV